MEPVGLAVGIAGLAGVFMACVDCFEYVQLGREFGKDYEKCLLRLDTARLRLSRWGAAVGLGSGPHTKPPISASDEAVTLSQSLLEQILETFKDAERISERFRKHKSMQNPQSEELLVCNTASSVDSDYRRLHRTMRELALERQKGTSTRKKITWALYEKKKFEGMIGDVVTFTDDLVALFPATQENQRALCVAEVSTIDKSQDLVLLNEVAGKDDQMFSAEITKELEKHGHYFTDWKAEGDSKIWAGDDNAPGVKSKRHNFARFVVSGHADVHLGNINRGH